LPSSDDDEDVLFFSVIQCGKHNGGPAHPPWGKDNNQHLSYLPCPECANYLTNGLVAHLKKVHKWDADRATREADSIAEAFKEQRPRRGEFKC
jgi:hypothetical protein